MMDETPERDEAGEKVRTKGTLMQRLGILPAIAGGLVAALIVLGIVDFLVGEDPIPPLYSAEIAAEDESLLLRASYAADSQTLTVERLEGAPAAGRALEMWLIPAAEGATPISLGLLPEGPLVAFQLPAELVPSLDRGTLAVSDEPPGGSETGAPSGTVLAIGEITPV